MKQKELKCCRESQERAETDVHGRLGVPQPVGVVLAVSSCLCGLWSALQTARRKVRAPPRDASVMHTQNI